MGVAAGCGTFTMGNYFLHDIIIFPLGYNIEGENHQLSQQAKISGEVLVLGLYENFQNSEVKTLSIMPAESGADPGF